MHDLLGAYALFLGTGLHGFQETFLGHCPQVACLVLYTLYTCATVMHALQILRMPLLSLEKKKLVLVVYAVPFLLQAQTMCVISASYEG